ncbi:hypothetical protein HL653_06115 [Sphingomonas sp. AP4-R1]|uniref:hypothetical protein n=1 Tax=Sphingomonas sp. AP4-R1 TaxID=2735134 RepID=UPI0014936361|nr:hypothetical protein [Sphingomonas sp. AP4-R1]QJU57424.1 hypothetical protein HL653_06115 [Sphingomonas sp. AP4-R1]
MPTPYDALMRLRQREVDDLRIAISVQIDQLVSIENRHTVINAALAQAQDVTASEVLLNTQSYMARLRAERDAVTNNRKMAGARLSQLRDNAVEAYGALRAIHSAADDYRSDVERSAAQADQAFIDDLVGGRGSRRPQRRR